MSPQRNKHACSSCLEWSEWRKSKRFRWLSIRLHFDPTRCGDRCQWPNIHWLISAEIGLKFHSADVQLDKRSCHQLERYYRLFMTAITSQTCDAATGRCRINDRLTVPSATRH